MTKRNQAILIRVESSDQGTFGLLKSGGFSCFISELPDRNNLNTFSRILSGAYEVLWHKSPKFGWCYKLQNVPGRHEILIHKGNYVGDSKLGYKTNSHGCLLPALKLGTLNGQKAGLLSLPATTKLYEHFGQKPFILEILNADNTDSPL